MYGFVSAVKMEVDVNCTIGHTYGLVYIWLARSPRGGLALSSIVVQLLSSTIVGG